MYTMDHSDLTVAHFVENFIGFKRVGIAGYLYWFLVSSNVLHPSQQLWSCPDGQFV